MFYDYMMPQFSRRFSSSQEFTSYLKAEYKKTVIPSLRKK